MCILFMVYILHILKKKNWVLYAILNTAYFMKMKL